MSSTRFLLLLTILLLNWSCAKNISLPEGGKEMETFNPTTVDYQFLQGKAKFVLEEESGKITRGTLQVRAKKDSVLWFSLSPGLGVEAIRGLITTDKIQLNDRLGKENLQLSYEEFEKQYGIDLSIELFQNLLWANIPYAASFEDRLLRVGKKFELTQVRNKVRYFSKIDTRHGKVSEVLSNSLTAESSLLASYPKFQETHSQLFPSESLFKVNLKAPQGTRNFRIYLQWTSVDPQSNTLSFPFRY